MVVSDGTAVPTAVLAAQLEGGAGLRFRPDLKLKLADCLVAERGMLICMKCQGMSGFGGVPQAMRPITCCARLVKG